MFSLSPFSEGERVSISGALSGAAPAVGTAPPPSLDGLGLGSRHNCRARSTARLAIVGSHHSVPWTGTAASLEGARSSGVPASSVGDHVREGGHRDDGWISHALAPQRDLDHLTNPQRSGGDWEAPHSNVRRAETERCDR